MFYSKRKAIQDVGEALQSGDKNWNVYPYLGQIDYSGASKDGLVKRISDLQVSNEKQEKIIASLLSHLRLEIVENEFSVRKIK